ncbi:MAG: RHS repeat-associated core domain-containing protein, partial [Bacteroidales bacterium]|nr:RHS repeat-associated core domain-containing protein [Bacteroidales bacterium]
RYDVNISYDLNGNITHLGRTGEIITKTKSGRDSPPSKTTGYELIDDLTYTYNGNQLKTVSDAIGEIETQLNNDFRDVVTKIDPNFHEYYYDANGNMTKDLNKGINLVTYNHLNQPTVVDFGTKRTEYTYTATGVKLQTKIYVEGKWQNTTDYAGAYVYENDKLSFINIPGGRIIAQSNEYQYNLTDHLGNVRVTFTEKEGKATIIQEDHYYPFGMRMNGMHVTNTDLINKYLYNGKELQDQTNLYDYGYRQMDPQLGRWHVVDALAEYTISSSPYAYVSNNPIFFNDPTGLLQNPGFNSSVWDMIEYAWLNSGNGETNWSGNELMTATRGGGGGSLSIKGPKGNFGAYRRGWNSHGSFLHGFRAFFSWMFSGVSWKSGGYVEKGTNTITFNMQLGVVNSVNAAEAEISTWLGLIKDQTEKSFRGYDRSKRTYYRTRVSYNREADVDPDNDYFIQFVSRVTKVEDGILQKKSARGIVHEIGNTRNNRIQILAPGYEDPDCLYCEATIETIGQTGAHELGHTYGLRHQAFEDPLNKISITNNNLMYVRGNRGSYINLMQLIEMVKYGIPIN